MLIRLSPSAYGNQAGQIAAEQLGLSLEGVLRTKISRYVPHAIAAA